MQLEIALAERLFTTFGDKAKVVLDGTYRDHQSMDEPQEAKELFNSLHASLQSQADPLAYEMVGERNIASILTYFRVGHDIDHYIDALKWVDDIQKHRKLLRSVEGMEFTLVRDTRHVLDNAKYEVRLKAEELDGVLKDRLAAQFGPFSTDVYQALYQPLISEELREVELDQLKSTLAGSPWSSTSRFESMTERDVDGKITNTPKDRSQAAERLRFLLKTHTPGQPNPLGTLLDFEARIAEQVR